MVKVKRALISVSNKTGIVDFARELKEFGVEIISTGGTAKVLREAGVEVVEVSSVTGFPEILEGRVKTLHPVISAGILADKTKESHLKQLEELNIKPIDMIVVNLYPFKEIIAKEGVTLEEAIENIDIGGPTMLRAAAKNYNSVVVIVNHHRYTEILEEMKKNDGSISTETCFDLAKEVFEHTADYDETIHHYLIGKEAEEFPSLLTFHFEKIQDLRYGENPHQRAAYYREIGADKYSLVYGEQLHGKELSFNNILDMESGWGLVKTFKVPACVIIKHTNPCGVALGKNLVEAYQKAYECDSVSAFGGVVAVNEVVTEELARLLTEVFYEIVIAPAFIEEALEILMEKKNLRLIYMGEERVRVSPTGKDLKRIDGGLLLQDYDVIQDSREEMKVVTKVQPTKEEWENLLFSWQVARYVKSNAIVLAKGLTTVGVGAGQMSRIDSMKIALEKSGEKARGSVLASDAFFPFRDVVDLAAKAGIKAIIQPGGAMRDQDSIDACNENGLAMVFTGKRHFKH